MIDPDRSFVMEREFFNGPWMSVATASSLLNLHCIQLDRRHFAHNKELVPGVRLHQRQVNGYLKWFVRTVDVCAKIGFNPDEILQTKTQEVS